MWRYRARSALTSGLVVLLGLSVASCNPLKPKLDETETTLLERSRYPYQATDIFTTALRNLQTYANKSNDRIVVMVKPFANQTGKREIPYNLTQMVIGALNQLSGPTISVKPFDRISFNNGVQPTVFLSGAVTRFDADVAVEGDNKNADVLFGGGKTETDLGVGVGSNITRSNVSVVMYLTNARTHVNIPGLSLNNSIDVVRVKKGNDFNFVIYGSGLRLNGSVEVNQGVHKAINNLVDYSVLQLFSSLYEYPYWWDIGYNEADPQVIESLKNTFDHYDKRKQVQTIQHRLNDFDLAPGLGVPQGERYAKLQVDGVLGPNTKKHLGAFLEMYAPSVNPENLRDVYGALRAHEDPRK